ncbi:MAG: Na/Pi cotransporter family protein [Ruminococcaceae bacterium]|nr:Na/Pi cotransporter family protein [Oscillospiraceae bacterium]
MNFYDVFALLGGLAFFLYGMHVMGEALEQRAGSRLKPILESLTSKPIKGVLVGTIVTATIQSSSSTTVMLVGFVNSGVMKLSQAINVIMGANIGTTITAWILSLAGIESNNFWVSLLKPSTFSPILAFIGIVMLLFSKRKKSVSLILIGFSVLMYGMDLMSGAVKGLADTPEFVKLLTLFDNPLFGILAGAVVTAIIQSSSASVGILQAISMTGTITFETAIPIIFGQNIGTCITAIISSIGANRNAKRVAIAHLFFNIIGTTLFSIILFTLNAFVKFAFMSLKIDALGIAIVHSTFNILATIILFPFSKQLERIARFIVPDGKEEMQFEVLDERLLTTPPVAIEQSKKLTGEMAILSRDAMIKAIEMVNGSYNDKDAEAVSEMEEKVDMFEDKLGSYLIKVSMESLSEDDSREVSKLLHIIGDFERISDHALNLSKSAQEMSDKRISFSAQAQSEISTMSSAVTEVLVTSVNCFINDDIKAAASVEPLEQVIDKLKNSIKKRHIKRLQDGSCTIELGFVLSDMLTDLERVADHCSNIAASVIEMKSYGTIETHQFLRDVRSGEMGDSFSEMYEGYRRKYALNK